MNKLKLMLYALVGANLIGLLLHSNSGKALECLQSAVEAGKPYANTDPWANDPAVPASSSKTPKRGLTISDHDIDAALVQERQERQAETHSALPIGAPAQAESAPDEPVADEPVAQSEPMIDTIYGPLTREQYNATRRAMPLGGNP